MSNFKRMGLFPTDQGSALPSRTGLFGTSLRPASLVLAGDQKEAGFEFKASYQSDRMRIVHEGFPYDYEGDLEYKMAVNVCSRAMKRGQFRNNLDFMEALKKQKLRLLPQFVTDESAFARGPIMAPMPDDRDRTGYVYPSYIVWDNDPSYILFLGSPDNMELPEDVLRQTRGHPEPGSPTGRYYRPGFSPKWIA